MTEYAGLSPEAVERLTLDSEPWLSCDECFEQLDGLAETLLGSSDLPSEALRVHLRACPACHEEATALVTLVADDYHLSREGSLARIEAALAH